MNAPEHPPSRAAGARVGVVIDRAARRAFVDGQLCDLSPRLFDALLFFAERAGQLLGKQQLLEGLWPGAVVEENNLSQLVAALRRTLGDDARSGRFIQTVPRRGFRWIADTRFASPDDAAPPPEPAQPEPPGAAVRSVGRDWRAPRLAAMIVGAALLVVIGLLGVRRDSVSGSIALAVQPFKPLLADSSDPVLEAGMAASLRARLANVPRVALRVADAGPAGSADAVWQLDGTVHRLGDRVRVYAQLRAADGQVAWSGTFDERYTHVFALHDAVAERVVATLAPRLTERRSAPGGTADADAFAAYALARLYLDTSRVDRLPETVQLLQRAIARDARFAQAHAALALAYTRMPLNLDTPPAEAFEPARKAAARARALLPTLAEAHVAEGFVQWWYERDPQAAERWFGRAQELEPGNALANFSLGHLLASFGRFDEGFVLVQRARELSPMTPLYSAVEAGYLAAQGQSDAAQQRFDYARSLVPAFWIGDLGEAVMLLRLGKVSEAAQRLERARTHSGGVSTILALQAIVHAQQQKPAQARAILAEFNQRLQSRYVPPTALAAVHVALGEYDDALRWLELAYDARDVHLANFKRDARWAPLRRDPRFLALARKLGVDVIGPPAKSAH